MAEGKLTAHFGHCQQFAFVEVDDATKEIGSVENLTPPPHEPGVLPRWVAENGATLVIGGGMGMQAQKIFQANGVEVVVGAPSKSPEEIVKEYFAGTLISGQNACDH